jgi:hypothetical protein
MPHPLLRFTISPLLASRLASVRQFYTLQANQRLLLVLQNVADDGRPVSVPAGCRVGYVTAASFEELTSGGQHNKKSVFAEKEEEASIQPREKNSLKRKREEEEEGEYIESDDDSNNGDNSVVSSGKQMRSDGEKPERSGGTPAGEPRDGPETAPAPGTDTTVVDTNSNRNKKKRKRDTLRGNNSSQSSVIRTASVASVGSGISSSINTPTQSELEEGAEDSAVVSVQSPPKRSVVALANNEKMVIDTNASFMSTGIPGGMPTVSLASIETMVIEPSDSFMTAASVVLPSRKEAAAMSDSRTAAAAPRTSGGILCLDVETVSDGVYSQFSQIGAVLSLRGRTSAFGAQVG